MGEPAIRLVHGRGGEIDEQLREVALRVDVVASACAGEVGEDHHTSCKPSIIKTSAPGDAYAWKL